MWALALLGVSQQRGGTEALQAWSTWLQQQPGWPRELLCEVVPITTCNRAELVLALAEGASLEEVRRTLIPPSLPRGYAFAGEGALEHLCRVAASLDSLNPGEDQIMQQVRQAFEAARQAGTVGPLTSFAFQQALRIAKRVRREIPLAPAHTSLFSLARPEFEARLPRPARVAVVGAGEMGRLAARSLAASPDLELWLVNRTEAKARELALTLGARYMTLEAFLENPPDLSGLVTATRVPNLIGAQFLRRQPNLRAIVDLGLPPNVDPAAVAGHPVALIDLNWMQRLGQARRQRLQADLARAEQIVLEELDQALADWSERAMGAAIVQMRETYRQTLQETVGELLEPELVQRLAHRFAHFPVKGLRGLARKHGVEAAQAFLLEAGLTGRPGRPDWEETHE
ncbi:glutamyl-tRNA reductase [Meiothermus sp.]|jgi:glutamyl-tRNA reductase|uniref:glutamyl-tRNA reductase n=1 Tax=Meiothermus sp. TaxID=1955249 RepID=UPI0021DEA0FF|nr:glutamyl-tRNA reductase [Meiothermus sp.]GIW24139.1 MAG: glutamyl-tRNA reductase [Meiothermus sp.]